MRIFVTKVINDWVGGGGSFLIIAPSCDARNRLNPLYTVHFLMELVFPMQKDLDQ